MRVWQTHRDTHTDTDPHTLTHTHSRFTNTHPQVSVSFAEQPGKMVPAEAVLGGMDDAIGECEC